MKTQFFLLLSMFGVYQHPQSLVPQLRWIFLERQLCVYIGTGPHSWDSPLSSHELTLALSRQASTSLLTPQTNSGT